MSQWIHLIDLEDELNSHEQSVENIACNIIINIVHLYHQSSRTALLGVEKSSLHWFEDLEMSSPLWLV